MNRTFGNLVMLLVGGYLLFLAQNGGLAYYIHPRYFNFAIACGALLSVVAVVSIIEQLVGALGGGSAVVMRMPGFNVRQLGRAVWANILIIILLGFAFLTGPTSLSARMAAQRASNLNTTISTSGNVVSNFVTDTSKYSINDWVNLLMSDTNTAKYVGQKVNVVGFVFQTAIDQQHFLLARFIVRCCVIDATPVGLVIELDDWHNQYSEGQWLQLQGEFALSDNPSQQGKLVIVPSDIQFTDPPNTPYVY